MFFVELMFFLHLKFSRDFSQNEIGEKTFSRDADCVENLRQFSEGENREENLFNKF